MFTALEMSAIRLVCVCSSFDLEWSPSCRGDAVEVSRGPEFSAGGQLAGRYCGSRQPTRTTLPGAVWVRFRSNANNATGRGFVASYMSRMRAVATDVVRWRGLCVSVCLSSTTVEKGKGSPYSITERRVPELIPVLGSQPAGDVSHKPGGRLPLLSARPAVAHATIKRAATSFAAW